MTQTKKPFHLLGAVVTTVVMVASVVLMMEGRAAILRDGQDIVLKTQPIDPRDLLRGRYVRLNYEISSVQLPEFESVFPDDSVWNSIGTPMFVTLEENEDGRYVAGSVSLKPPENGLFLKGRIASGAGVRFADGSGTLRLAYGIERFYASETVAPDLEKRMRDGAITDVVVAVSAEGRAQIRALKQGERVFFTEELY